MRKIQLVLNIIREAFEICFSSPWLEYTLLKEISE